ncbi:hypothetical protein HDU76_013829 [Blyttiomyces sp. JEL0837]|nr:hypothetical protein HDU76_013829 [Blyttiomyces sp. JEL0837]
MARNLFPVGVYPLAGIMAFAVGGCSYYLFKLVQHQDVVLNKRSNPHPWLTVQQGYTTKFYDPSGHFEGRYWKRTQL